MFKKFKVGLLSMICCFTTGLASCSLEDLYPKIDENENTDNSNKGSTTKKDDNTAPKTDDPTIDVDTEHKETKEDTGNKDKETEDEQPKDDTGDKDKETEGGDGKEDGKEDGKDDGKEDEPIDTSVAVEKVEITNEKFINILINDTLQLNYSITPANATDQTITWTSNNNAVATVSNSGLITGKSIGDATIKATAHNGKYALYAVIVSTNVPLQSINSDEDEYNIPFESNGSFAPTITFNPTNAKIRGVQGKLRMIISSTNVLERKKVSDNVYDATFTIKAKGTTNITYYEDKNSNKNLDSGEIFKTIKVNVKDPKDLNPFMHSVDIDVVYLPDSRKMNISDPRDYIKEASQIYYLDNNKDVPYIELGEMKKVFRAQNENPQLKDACNITRKDDNTFELVRSPAKVIGSNAPIVFDVTNQKVTADNWNLYMNGMYGVNNGYYGDIASPYGMVQTSDKTKAIVEGKKVEFDLAKYKLKLYSFDSKLYLPFHLACKLVLGDDNSMVFDGRYIYSQKYINETNMPFFYANKNSFLFDVSSAFYGYLQQDYTKVTLTKKQEPSSGYIEEYATSYKSNYINYVGRSTPYNVEASLKFKSTMAYFESKISGLPSSMSSFESQSECNMAFSYQKLDFNGETVYKLESGNFKTFIYLHDSKYNKEEITKNEKEYNYNFLCFELDYFYGIAEDLGVTSFDSYFADKQVSMRRIKSDGSLETSTRTLKNHYATISTMDDYNYFMQYLLLNTLGDGHTNLLESTIFNRYNCNNIEFDADAFNRNERLKTLSTKGRTCSNACEEAGVTKQVSIYQDTAVLRFNNFTGNLIKAGYNYETDFSAYSNYNAYISADTFIAIAAQMAILKNNSDIKKIVFDVTNNGGGTVFTVPLLMAFMTTDPQMIIKNKVDGSITEFHYKVDLNGDGAYGGPEDTLKDRFSFYVLTSGYSFSCGTLFPTVCKNTGCAKIIGEQSGGGACPVGKGTDCFGTYFNISQSRIAMLKDGNSYTSNDKGVPVDLEVNITYWYNENISLI